MSESLKEKAVDFLKSVAFGDVQGGYDKYVAPNFIHHNQYFKGDRQSLLTAMADAHVQFPNKVFEPKKVYQDGNTVIVHSLVENSEMKIAVLHVLRFENDKVVEMWDVGQALDKNSPNENGPF